jgi:predicted metal-dependent TIM-barrel fold hydrolase
MEYNIEKYINKFNNNYYQNLINQLRKNKSTKYINHLNSLIQNNIDTENVSETITMTEQNLSEDYVYRKQWNKLNIIHKKIKLKEFVNKLHTSSDNKKELLGKVLKMLASKKFNKNTDVNYDHVNGHIVSIPVLKIKDDKYYI